jgi:hypothetical protein
MIDNTDSTNGGGTSSVLDDATISNEESLAKSEEPAIPVPQIREQQPLERGDSTTRRRTPSARRINRPHGWENPGVLNSLSRVYLDHLAKKCQYQLQPLTLLHQLLLAGGESFTILCTP